MTKEQLINAINAMQDGKDKGYYHDELSALLSIVNSATDSDIAKAWSDVSEG